MKVYELRFASASTPSQAPTNLRPPDEEPGWTIHSWRVVDSKVTVPTPAGPGMHSPATLASTQATLLVLWERDVQSPPPRGLDHPMATSK